MKKSITSYDVSGSTLIPLDLSSPFNSEYLLLKEVYFEDTMCPDHTPTMAIREVFYLDTNQWNTTLNVGMPNLKKLDCKELKNIYNKIKREKKTFLTKSQSILIWKMIKILEGNWDDDLGMTCDKAKKLCETDEEFLNHYQDVKKVPVW